jgi:hypothetical protein
MSGQRFPIAPSTVELAQQLRRGMEPDDLDATADEIVAAYRLWTAALIREGRFAADMARCGLDLAAIAITSPTTGAAA